MVFQYKGFTLYKRIGEYGETIYFFSPNPTLHLEGKDATLCDMPDGYILRENDRGVPIPMPINLKCPKCGSNQIQREVTQATTFWRSGRVDNVCQKCGHILGRVF